MPLIYGKNKTQRKQLATTVTTNVLISSAVDVNFKFDNLEVGKNYLIHLSGAWSVLENDANASVIASNGATAVCSLNVGMILGANTADTAGWIIGNSRKFTATDTTITFSTSSLTLGTQLIAGSNTYAELTELQDDETTTDFT